MATRKWHGAPLWVNVLHSILEWIDYKIACPFSSWLMNTRMELLDNHCSCEVCHGRYAHKRGV